MKILEGPLIKIAIRGKIIILALLNVIIYGITVFFFNIYIYSHRVCACARTHTRTMTMYLKYGIFQASPYREGGVIV